MLQYQDMSLKLTETLVTMGDKFDIKKKGAKNNNPGTTNWN